MNFSKAFDDPPHGRLIPKVEDPGVQVDSSLKVKAQIDRVVNKAHVMLAFISEAGNRSWRHHVPHLDAVLVEGLNGAGGTPGEIHQDSVPFPGFG